MGLLERRGAEVLRCPLVGIHDSLDTQAVDAWLDRAIRQPFDDLILLTGEGLRRLWAFAHRGGRDAGFRAALEQMRCIVRGPKPAKALRELGLGPGLSAAEPTTAGVIQTLSREDLHGRRIGLQLYGDEDNLPLQDFLKAAGAEVHWVKPYRYADAAEDSQVQALIQAVAAGGVQALLFTSQPQVHRLRKLASKHPDASAFSQALGQSCQVVAVGPVVGDALKAVGWPVNLMPTESYFMKPMVQAMVDHFSLPKG